MGRKSAKSSKIAGNDDLLTDGILLRLPAKSLVRFQSVCKHWRSLILSRSFGLVHTRRSIHSGGGGGGEFIFTPSESNVVVHFNPISKSIHNFQFPHTSKVKILQSSNGLWLLELDGGKRYSVHNPTTKQSRLLESTPRAVYAAAAATGLVFDPSVSIHYKALFVYNEVKAARLRVETFDSETEQWTSVYYPSSPTLRRDWIHLNNKVYSMSWSIYGTSSFLDLQTGKAVRVPKINLTGGKPGVGVKPSSLDFPSRYHFVGPNGRLRYVVIAEYFDYYYNEDTYAGVI